MKNYLILALTVILFTMTSCDEDPDAVTITEVASSFTVDLSGDLNAKYEQDSLTAYTHAGLVIVKAYDASGNDMWILFEVSKVSNPIGTHAIGRTGEPVQINFNYADGSHNFSAESGTLTISAYDGASIEGTFEFESKDFSNQEVTISGANGQFSAQIK